MAYRIAVCDDSSRDATYIRTLLEDWAATRQMAIHPQVFSSAESFLFQYAEDKAWDVLLLDIEMDQMDGVTLAKTIRRDNAAVQIVFITGYSDYIAEGYDVAALHYLMKPVQRDKFFTVLDRSVEKRQQDEKCLNLDMGGEMIRIPFYEIRYMNVHLNYVTIHARQDFTLKRSLSEFEKELDGRFLRVGRSMILNLKSVRRVTRTEVYLSDGTSLPLPRGMYEPLNRAIIERT